MLQFDIHVGLTLIRLIEYLILSPTSIITCIIAHLLGPMPPSSGERHKNNIKSWTKNLRSSYPETQWNEKNSATKLKKCANAV